VAIKKLDCCVGNLPVSGDVFVCGSCKMTLTLLRDCGCDDVECVSLSCCGKPMTLVNCEE